MIKLRNLFCFILTIVCFWYQISGTRNPAIGHRIWYQFLAPVFWYQFLLPVFGQYVMGITRYTTSLSGPRCKNPGYAYVTRCIGYRVVDTVRRTLLI